MRTGNRCALLLAALGVLGSSPLLAAEGPTLVIGAGALQSITVEPNMVALRGADQVRQLVVTGLFANGGSRDLTCEVVWRVADPSVVRIERGGLLVALKSGATEVMAEAMGQSVKVPVAVEGAEQEQSINFTNQIVPIFS